MKHIEGSVFSPRRPALRNVEAQNYNAASRLSFARLMVKAGAGK